MNYHTLSDFRVDHEKALDDLMTEVLAMLMERDIVRVHRVSQDGLRVRASAGKSSFRREGRLQSLLEQAQSAGGGPQGPAGSPGRYGSQCPPVGRSGTGSTSGWIE